MSFSTFVIDVNRLLDQSISDADFLVVDVETTGLSADDGDRVCEVGAVKLRGGAVVETFGTLINPQRPISAGAYAVNKISPQMVAEAPTFGETAARLSDMMDDAVLVAYNAPFDLSFFSYEFRMAGFPPIRNPVVDALALARQLLPGLQRYPQDNVANVIGIPFPVKHRASDDALVTSQIFSIFVNMLKAYDVVLVNDLLRRDLSMDLHNKRMQLVGSAMSTGSRLWIKYLSPSNAEITERFVTPKQLAREVSAGFRQGPRRAGGPEVVYLIAHCHSVEAERTFRIDRILDMKLA